MVKTKLKKVLKNRFLLLLLFVPGLTFTANAQNINGTFPALSRQVVKLNGFSGFENYTIDSALVKAEGEFSLSFGIADYGMGVLTAADNKPFAVVLGKEGLSLKGESFAHAESIEIVTGTENKLFAQYATEHARREQCLSAWDYLEKIYSHDSLFSVQQTPKQAIDTERQRIKTEDSLFLAGLPKNFYLSYYLPLRKLVSSVSTIVQYRTDEIPATIQAFRQIDYTDKRLYKSGMLKEVIESHFWLIENSGRSLDSVYVEMNKSTDILVENLLTNEKKLNEITGHLFKFLEKRSLFKASEYLAIKLLNEQGCTLSHDLASQLESYRAMKEGNTAPDIVFNGDVKAPGYSGEEIPQSLLAVQSTYKVVVFGASWCPHCPAELQKVAQNYNQWARYGVEVVFVSLDENEETFKSFIQPFPFISTCDFQKWEGQAANDYHVFATPTIYLLDNKNKIVLKPNSAEHLKAWIDWNLIKKQ